MRNILVTGSSVESRFLEPLRQHGYVLRNPTHLLTESELTGELSEAVGYLLGGDEIASKTALATADALKVIAFLGVGYESFIDVAAAAQLGITITNTPGTLTNSVAEFTIGQLLNARRRLTEYSNAFAAGRSGNEQKQRDIGGHAVGILGLGALGTRTAEILVRGFDADVQYFSRTRKPDEEQRLGIRYVPLEELFRSSESLIILIPGNPQTYGLVSSELLDLMPSDSVLINTARPDVVDPNALLKALLSGRPAIAAFDGFYSEPKQIAEELQGLGQERLIITGHIASLTHDARDAMAIRAVSSLLNLLNGKPDPYVVVPGRRK